MGKLKDTYVKSAKYGAHGDGAGLWLIVQKSGTKSWVFKYSYGTGKLKKQHAMGLGSYPTVSLAEARGMVLDAKQIIRAGLDPIEEKKKAEKAKLEKLGQHFKTAAQLYVDSKKSGYKSTSREASKILSSLTKHAFPIIGDKPCSAITLDDITRILKPLWDAKKANAGNALQKYLEAVLDYATVKGWRSGDNPAKWKNNLSRIFPPPFKINPKTPHYKLNLIDIPSLVRELQRSHGTSALCLEFILLTAVRSGEARKARWDNIDLDSKIWTVPAEDMKSSRPHRVPLSDAAINVLKRSKELNKNSLLVFPSSVNKPLTDNAILKMCKRASHNDKATVHGLRASFRTWAGEETNHPREVAEHALAHAVGAQFERSYSRGDMLSKRRTLMDDWAKTCIGGSNV